ncbi:class I SAM-dependent methyltransferase [Amnibacterium kyonggiense]|uniref:Methyltransferase family protein n=1 Tax=Amnibacterium kyonggiense TaxID=595671 RepID=A0A4R7FSH4_9MICO|nr:class I SAM-dependent methyltransferase [Amnibacterium kyonggiense]TDS80811.1 methyltransferase family protein [Amnibacterium kyonggiense]
MFYYAFLAELHRRLAPRAYLEIGVRDGGSLAQSHCRSVAIDPAFAITAELDADVALFRTTSDEYFARPEPLAPTGGRPFDLAFIDGLHLFEFALRDFIHAEQHASSRGLIVFDDVLPRSIDEAARERHTNGWTGDVYGMLEVLAELRPDLVVIPVGTRPTGLLLVTALDPTSTVLADRFDDLLARFRRPDPQPVPTHLLDRLTVLPPERLLESDLLEVLRAADADGDGLRDRVRETVARTLGPAFETAEV